MKLASKLCPGKTRQERGKVMKKLLIIIVVLLIDIAFVSAGFTCQAAISASEKEYTTKIKGEAPGFAGKVAFIDAKMIIVRGKRVAIGFDAKNPTLRGCAAIDDVKVGDTVEAKYIKDGIIITKLKGPAKTRTVRSKKVEKAKKLTKQEAISRVTDYMRNENMELEDEKLRNISEMVYDESLRYKLDYRLVLALMKIESNFRHKAVSKKGARGLLQIKPSLARYVADGVGVTWQGDTTLDEPDKNIKIGVHVFSKLINDFKSVQMALHAYHVGPTKLREILFEEKKPQKHYVNLVLDEYDKNVSRFPAP